MWLRHFVVDRVVTASPQVSRDSLTFINLHYIGVSQLRLLRFLKFPSRHWPKSDRPRFPSVRSNAFDLSNESSSRPTGRIGREKVSGLGKVAECVASAGVRMHTHAHALANGRRSSRRSTLDSKSVARTSTYVGGGDRERERERENRIGRQERAELRSAELPFLRTCLAASSSSPTDYDRLLLSLCMHLVRPQTYTLSFLFFFSVYLILLYIHLLWYLANCFVAKSSDK